MTRHRIIVALVAAATLMLPAVSANAGTAAFGVVGSVNSECCSAIAYNTTDRNYLVAWLLEADGVSEIWARVVDVNGGISNPRRISPSGEYVTSEPAVEYNWLKNQYMVVWSQFDDVNGDSDIIGQRVKANGQRVGDPVPIGVYTEEDIIPDIAVNTWTGQWLVVWTHIHASGDMDIAAQRLRPKGQLKGGMFWVAWGDYDTLDPSVAFNTMRRQYLVTWTDTRWGDDDPDIYGQRIRGVGVLKGDDIPIAFTTDQQNQSVVGYDAYDDRYLVVWTDSRGGGDVYGQLLAGWGGLRGIERLIGSGTNGDFQADVGRNVDDDPDARWMVVFRDEVASPADSDITAQVLDFKARPKGAPMVVANTLQTEFVPAISRLSDLDVGGWMTTWTHRFSEDDSDIWARLMG